MRTNTGIVPGTAPSPRRREAMGRRPNRLMRGVVTAALAGVLAIGALAGCGSSGSTQGAATASAADKTVSFAYASTGGTSLDPTDNYQGWVGTKLGVYETLFRLNDSFEPEPMLAESASMDDDTTWTIKIRDGVSFSDGAKLDAAAVKASLENMISKNERGKNLVDIASMDADGQTLTVHTNAKNVSLENAFTEPVTAIIDVAGTSDAVNDPKGTGPYTVSDTDAQGNRTLKANEQYWGGAPKVGTANAKFIQDPQAEVTALQSGELDAVSGLYSDQIQTFQNNPAYTVADKTNARLHMMFFNLDSPLMKDDKVREALSMVEDRDGYASSIYAGAATPTQGAFPERSGYSDGVSAPGYDLDKAKQVLADDGWKDTDGDGYLDKDGQRLTVRLATYEANPELPRICEVLTSTLKDLGVEVKVNVSEKISDTLKSGDWDMTTYAYSTLATGDPTNFLAANFQTGNATNYSHYSNPKVDELLTQLKGESDLATRKQITSQIQQAVIDDHAYIFLEHPSQNDVTSSKVTNLVTTGQYYYLTNQTDINQ